MAPTIRIDEEVYGWLQGNARPFEDTPNSVLRRIAGLDNVSAEVSTNGSVPTVERGKETKRVAQASPKSRSTQRGRGRLGIDGKQLNNEWKVGARHALFRSLSDFLCARGHEMIPKGKQHDRNDEHSQETQSTQAIPG